MPPVTTATVAPRTATSSRPPMTANRNRTRHTLILLGGGSLLAAGLYLLLRPTGQEEVLPPDESPNRIEESFRIIEEAQQMVNAALEQLAALEALIAEAIALLGEQEELLDELDSIIVDAWDTLAGFGGDIDRAIENVENIAEFLEQLRQALLDLESDAAGSSQLIAALLADVAARQAEIAELQAILQETKAKISALEQKLGEAQAIINQLRQTNEQLLAALQQAQANANAAMAALNESMQIIQRLQYALQLVDVTVQASGSGTNSAPDGVRPFAITVAQKVRVDWTAAAEGAVTQCMTAYVRIINRNGQKVFERASPRSCCPLYLIIPVCDGTKRQSGTDYVNLPVGEYTAVATKSGHGGWNATIKVTYKTSRFLVENVPL